MGGRTLSRLSRRGFLGAAAAAVARPSFAAGAGPGVVVPHPTDVRVEEMRHRYEDFRYRTPIKFGGRAVDRVTLLNVDCVVRTRGGRTAKGFGSMPLGNVWAFPSRQLPYEETLGAMKALADRIADDHRRLPRGGHPIDLAHDARAGVPEGGGRGCQVEHAGRADPEALHAGGRQPVRRGDPRRLRQGARPQRATRRTGPDSCRTTSATTSAPEFTGEHLDRYVLADPRPRMPLYHLVGALDPLDRGRRSTARIGDGLPETLPSGSATTA